MSDTPNAATSPAQTNVQAKPVRQVRIMETKERPDDALLEVTTGTGETLYLILPAANLPQLAEKLTAFSQRRTVDSARA